ncbi:MAG: glutathione S-transferase family protein [Parvibaculum sp.]|uniref:glutathione S-transferase family protein n=1 Tax=Parvibaculum sp. TaxID=2024848 RepID=UPI003C716F95
MSLTLHMHPLSSFCHKALIALYENDTPFEICFIDLGDDASATAFKALWPIGKMPVLRDEARNQTIPETTIIIEYLQSHYPGRIKFIPDDRELALQTRLSDRFYDLYVQQPMQKIVTDNIRPAGANDPHGVAEARALLRTACDLVERDMATRIWAVGDAFSLADCAAAPALFYADKVAPLAQDHPNAARYLDRLMARPSFARVLDEAKPYFAMFPG